MTTVYDLIANNQAFVNPVAGAITSARDAIDLVFDGATLNSEVRDTLLGLGLDPPAYLWTEPEVQQLEALLTPVSDVLTQFDTLTNDLSGLTTNPASPTSLKSLLPITNTLQRLQGVQSCSIVNNIFEAISNGANLMNGVLQSVASILLAPVSEVLAAVGSAISAVTDLITETFDRVQNAINEVINRAFAESVGSLLGNECAKEIIRSVSSGQLKQILSL